MSALLDVDSNVLSVQFANPIRVKQNSAVTFNKNATTGVVIITGFTLDNPNA